MNTDRLFGLRGIVWVWMVVLAVIFCGGVARGAEVIPPAPARYFNDYAKVISPQVAESLNEKLTQFERDTSNQIVVAVYPKMQSDSDVADYTFRVKESWHVGQQGKNNGAVLFVFVQDRKAFIQTNYGLEGSLPDATCNEIINEGITPLLKNGNYDGALSAGVAGILAATKGEYKGNGQTDRDRRGQITSLLPCVGSAIGLFLLVGLFLLILRNVGGTFYQNHARSIGFAENTYLFILNMAINMIFSAGSSGSSGGRDSGGFSGGGGTGGGGGAGGSW